ncbi:Dps family protein [Wenyingzhuangia marina]|uniref:Starvation-inducible DNA-binding protein n=1 Tax=Wenyingzhuangia marina TaxID=1195760 RepID=A0A1M5V4G9_9FLAO|nr:DNA starvation/stationary phase protection protein [Wenyingzhuangia marina]GGF74479.1 DNA starvation/stationary phase protection protein [Wenyingzhuangia marina]SHH70076.1 starvation-inducible DNA-binding protein [Wenyingzhuangia marina]
MNYLNQNNEKLIPVVSELNGLLADYHIYYQKLRNFHWNVEGRNFFDLHEKFEEMYNDARTKIDEIAERILTLRHHPVSRYSDYLEISKIEESDTLLEDIEMVETLLSDHGILISKMSHIIKVCENAEDEGTIDLVGAYIRELEKTSWMLNAWSKSTKKEKVTA